MSQPFSRVLQLEQEVERLRAELRHTRDAADANRHEEAVQRSDMQDNLRDQTRRAGDAEGRLLSMAQMHDTFVEDSSLMARVLEASNDCIKVISLDGRLTYMSTGGQRVMEIDDVSTIIGCPWPDFWQPPHRDDVERAMTEARAGRSTEFVGFAHTAKGSSRWWEVTVMPMMDDTGAPERILSISRDITARKEAEDRKTMLADELQHRVQNLLAVVSAIVQQSLKGTESVADARVKIANRLQALSHAYRFVGNDSPLATSLADVVSTAIKPYDGGGSRIVAAGVDCPVGPKAALAFTLALNELCTNATKYGALSNEAGRVSVAGEERDGSYSLVWTESSGPLVTPPTRMGFGSKLIQRGFEMEVGGKSMVTYDAEGLRCRLEVPIANLRL